MKKKLVIAQFMMILLVGDVHGQATLGKVRERARLFEPIIFAAATRYNVDPHLLWTIAYLESRFKPQAISYKDGEPCAFGLMQFVPATARRYGLTNPHNPREAIDAAARYLRDLLKRFDGRGDLVLAAYNAGEGTVDAFRDGKRLVLPSGKVVNPNAIRTGGIPPYAETRQYVAQGIKVYQNITRQRPSSALTKSLASETIGSPEIDPKQRVIEASIYISNSGSKAHGPLERDKGSQMKKGGQPQSLYPN